MGTIKLQGTDDTPSVILDKDAGLFEFSGRSLPEDVNAFYEPVLEWLSNYSENPNEQTIVTFKLVYFNTASSKLILDILLKFEEISEKGSDVLIKWYYPEDDEDMQEAGQEYSEIVEIQFEQISYNL
jgi:hypothetical protein